MNLKFYKVKALEGWYCIWRCVGIKDMAVQLRAADMKWGHSHDEM
jgi:hypothetical protein